MRNRLRQLLLMLCFGFVILGYGQAESAPQELSEFAYNRAVAVSHARAALEDVTSLMMPQQPLSEFDFSRPSLAAVLAKDCAGKEINVILVAFPGKKNGEWAFSHWERNRDGLINRMLSVGFTVESFDSLVRQARNGGEHCL